MMVVVNVIANHDKCVSDVSKDDVICTLFVVCLRSHAAIVGVVPTGGSEEIEFARH